MQGPRPRVVWDPGKQGETLGHRLFPHLMTLRAREREQLGSSVDDWVSGGSVGRQSRYELDLPS